MTDLIGALRTNLLLLIVSSGLAVLTCVLALLVLGLLVRVTRRARDRMIHQQYDADSEDYVRVTRAFGWFTSLRDTAGLLIFVIIAFGLEPVIPALSIAVPATAAIVISLVRTAPYRSWSGEADSSIAARAATA